MQRNWQSPKNSVGDVKREVCKIIVDVLDVDASTIHADSRFREDLGADSLDLVTLIMAFSNAFEAEICDRDVLYIQTVGEAIGYLEQHLTLESSNAPRL